MCDSHPFDHRVHLNRREMIATAGLAAAALAAGSGAAGPAPAAVGEAAPQPGGRTAGEPVLPPAPVLPVQVKPGLFVLPRDAWGADLPPKSAIEAETVQFLLAHHTASPNTYPAGGSRDVIRTAYAWHTSATKGWADVCYQFFVDHDGVVYEGRAGALAAPVRADATGGSQGFAQLVCLVGDFTVTDPTPAMLDSLIKVLAWLADRYNIDTSPGAQTTFVSRGSQRFKAGTTVTTPTIGGHRDMSFTTCPGDRVYGLIDSIRAEVHAQRVAWKSAMYQAQRLPSSGSGRVGPPRSDSP